jgi:hypothetical protein
MEREALVLLAQAVASNALVGLIWTIQVVHYPLMRRVPESAYGAYQREHMRRITAVVGPLMLAEAATAAAVVVLRPAGVPMTLAWTGLGLVVLLWAMTATVQGPLHNRLVQGGKDDALLARLIASNWVRTAMWSARGVLSAWMLLLHAEAAAAGVV